ncbi:hypothetical protein D3C75_886310 [compost metagenome]
MQASDFAFWPAARLSYAPNGRAGRTGPLPRRPVLFLPGSTNDGWCPHCSGSTAVRRPRTLCRTASPSGRESAAETHRPSAFHCVGKGSLEHPGSRANVHSSAPLGAPSETASGGRSECFPTRSDRGARAYPECAKVHRPPRIPAGHARHHRRSAPRPIGFRFCGITTQQDRHRVAFAPRSHRCGPTSGQRPDLGRKCSNVWLPREPVRHETTPCQAPAKAPDQRAGDVGEWSPDWKDPARRRPIQWGCSG